MKKYSGGFVTTADPTDRTLAAKYGNADYYSVPGSHTAPKGYGDTNLATYSQPSQLQQQQSYDQQPGMQQQQYQQYQQPVHQPQQPMQPGNFNAPAPTTMMNPNAALMDQAKQREEDAKRKAAEDAERLAQEAIRNKPKTMNDVPQDQQFIIQQLEQLCGALQGLGLSGLQVRFFVYPFYKPFLFSSPNNIYVFFISFYLYNRHANLMTLKKCFKQL